MEPADTTSWAGPCLGWAGWDEPCLVVAGWAGPEVSLRQCAGPRLVSDTRAQPQTCQVETRLVCLTLLIVGCKSKLLVWVAGWAGL